MKKVISIILSIAIVFSVTGIVSSAENTVEYEGKTYDLTNEYPWVFVHGMGGWADYDGEAYWGGWADSEGDVIKMYNDLGVEAYAAVVGPFNSAWDRACELYAQLTGTVVDYGKAHSEAHNHDRYGYDYTDTALMGEPWDVESKIILVGHSFGVPAVRLFTSLLAYGDEAEVAATGDETSPLFTGGHDDCIYAVVSFSGTNNGSPIANMIHDSKPLMTAIAAFANIVGCLFGSEIMMWDVQLGHFGLTSKEGKAKFSWENIINFATTGDNCGYDMTLRGAKALNEKARTVENTYYYSYSTVATKETAIGTQVPIDSIFTLFIPTSLILGCMEGKTVDGVTLDKSWTISDGIVPVKSSLYPSTDEATATSYEAAIEAGEEIVPGRWYYTKSMEGFDHFDFCGTIDYPTSFEDFYYTLVETVNGNNR